MAGSWRGTGLAIAMLASMSAPVGRLSAQGTGSLRGVIVQAGDQLPVAGAMVGFANQRFRTVSDPLGRFALPPVPAGRHALLVRALGYQGDSIIVTIQAGSTISLEVSLAPAPLQVSEIVVSGASRFPETVMRAPAAITRVSPSLERDYGPTGQVPQILSRIPGVDAVQSGMNDWNVNARGFNTTNTRRVVVLLDGRDLALAFLGSQEWPALSIPLEDLGEVEFIRGPGSALYGPNAFGGVLTFTTPTAREVAGTKISVAGGEIGTLQGGVRHASVFGDGRFGYRVHGGYARTDTWARSRTSSGDLAREYADAIDTVRYPVRPPAPGFETIALQDDALTRAYGGARFDYYADAGTATAEFGHSVNENESMVTGAGRLQIGHAARPWARIAWESDHFKAFTYISNRSSDEQINLSSGVNIREESSTLHAETQYNQTVLGGRGRVVVGGSARSLHVDSDNTLLPPETDNRTDHFLAAFGQVEYDLGANVRALAAARLDGGNLFDTEFSPKAALVWTPDPRHALRLTVNRAFKTPVALEYFLAVPAAPPADFSGLEAALRASPLGPSLSDVPQGTLFTNSAQVPILALGNENLDVEHITSWEAGWKSQLTRGVFVTVDAYFARLNSFVTELLPGVNPTYAPWTAPLQVPAEDRATVAATVRDALISVGQDFVAAALTRLPDGSTAIVVSVGNSGRAKEYGVELGMTATLSSHFEVDANYSYSRFDVDESSFGLAQAILPNTPRHKSNMSIAYEGPHGLDLRASARLVSSFDWAGGVFVGRVPAQQTLDFMAGYRLTPALRAQLTATNVLDQRRYQVFGGPMIGRRVLAGMTATL